MNKQRIDASVEGKAYSQHGEDGVIHHIFKAIGVTNKIAVEIGVSVSSYGGVENNTTLLSQNGWSLYWFDIVDPPLVPQNCVFIKDCVTKDNIASHFERLNIPKEFDLLSIDIDSNDYYIREALKDYAPRVVISEYNGCFDGTVEHIMPYDESYVWPGHSDRTYGASLKSVTNQANNMGYDLVYCDTFGVNAFFIRKDINPFQALTSEEAWVQLHWSKE